MLVWSGSCFGEMCTGGLQHWLYFEAIVITKASSASSMLDRRATTWGGCRALQCLCGAPRGGRRGEG